MADYLIGILIGFAAAALPGIVLAVRCYRLARIIRQHDLCHNQHGKVDARAFADGCAAEQRKLYGCAPDADEATRLRSCLRQIAESASAPPPPEPPKPRRRTMWG